MTTQPSPSQSLDEILTKLEQLTLAPIAMEKIYTGDVFEAHNQAKAAITQLIFKAQLKELTSIGVLINKSKREIIDHYEERYKYLKEKQL